MGYEVIKEIARKKNIPLKDIANYADISYNSLSKIIRNTVKSPNYTTIKKIAEALNMTVDALGRAMEANSTQSEAPKASYDTNKITNLELSHIKKYRTLDKHGKELVDVVLDKETERIEELNVRKEFMHKGAEDEEECINLPLYDEPAAAGVGSYLDVGHYEEQSFPSSIVPRLTDYCVRIAGDSMEPDIPHGSIVFVQASPVVENGEVGIFLLGNHSYCKRLLIEQEEKKILLTSDNPKYDDIEIDATDSFNTLGKVLGVYDED